MPHYNPPSIFFVYKFTKEKEIMVETATRLTRSRGAPASTASLDEKTTLIGKKDTSKRSAPAGVSEVKDTIRSGAPEAMTKPSKTEGNEKTEKTKSDANSSSTAGTNRVFSAFATIFSYITSAPGAVVGFVKSAFSYVVNLFSKTKSEDAERSKEVNLIEDKIKTALTKAQKTTYDALVEAQSERMEKAMKAAVAKHDAVMNSKVRSFEGVKVTKSNKEEIALKAAIAILLKPPAKKE